MLGAIEVSAQENVSIEGLIQGQFLISADSDTSYLNRGTSILRNDIDDKFLISQALISISAELNSELALKSVINHVEDPKPHGGFTQLFLEYTPLWSPKYKWRIRGGMFYSDIGFENPDIGWLSPYHYTNSAISSWVGEEVRTLGTEFKVTKLGRAHGFSPHNFSASVAVFKGNDTAGTLLAWRGWALHDRQSLTNEKVFFARYPSIGPTSELPLQAAWVEPYREVDGRFGYQAGLHWDYRKKTQLKYTFYNNNADDSIVARGGQYAWNTLFHSLALQHKFTREWRVIAQAMSGSTAMGTGKVEVDYDAWYVSLIYRDTSHNVAVRYDNYSTTDTDFLQQEDNNNGHGWGLTATYRLTLNEHWQIGMEWLHIDSFQASRAQWPGRPTNEKHSQLMGTVQFRF